MEANYSKKCVVFARVSTQKQTIEQQTEVVVNEALRRGYDKENLVIIEEKESGSRLLMSERIGIQKLKSVIEKYENIECIILYELSRLSRRPADLYQIRDFLLNKKINLISLKPPMELLDDKGNFDPTASIIFGVYSSISEQEGYIRKERIMRGKEKKRSEGKLTCGIAKIGYTVDKDHYIIPHPKYSKVIVEVFERYAAHESSGSIGKDLFLRNALPINTNKEITYQTIISQILRDGRYAKIDEDSIYPPIISKELFYKVQDIISKQPERFKRKSLTKEVYPLQGYIYTTDNYLLIPSISNNRYLKMKSGGTATPFSLNMKAVHGLSMIIMNDYLKSGKIESDRQSEYNEASKAYNDNQDKILNIDNLITTIEKENEIINNRIIKGRISEERGDAMLDENIKKIHTLEDTRQELQYANSLLSNKLIYLSNPLVYDSAVETINNEETLKDAVHKYLKRVDVQKIGHSKYTLIYTFLDSIVKKGSFYSNPQGITYYDENLQEIAQITHEKPRR